LRQTGIEDVIHSQKRPLLDKRRAVWARMRLARVIPGMNAPEICLSRPPEFRPLTKDYIRGLGVLLMARLTERRWFLGLLRRVPARWLQRYDTFERLPDTG